MHCCAALGAGDTWTAHRTEWVQARASELEPRASPLLAARPGAAGAAPCREEQGLSGMGSWKETQR